MQKIILKLYYKFFTRNKGLIKEEKDNRDYQFGAGIKRKVLREDGQWTEFLPKDEKQRNPLETMACTNFALLNCIEIINKAKYNETKNYSDRFLAKCSGTTKYGNNMRKVLETLRKYYGVVREKKWQGMGFYNWDEYYKKIPQDILKMAQLWIKEYKLEYESVNSSKNAIMRALKYSPLYTAGFAWRKDKNGIYQSYGKPNHCFVIVGYKQNEYWLAFDSYSPFLKKLDWNYKFYYSKSIYLEKKSVGYNQEAINKLKKRGYKYVMRVLGDGSVYELKDDKLLKITPQDIKDITIIDLSDTKQLIGINEEFFNSLII